jgi:hypothetical protein
VFIVYLMFACVVVYMHACVDTSVHLSRMRVYVNVIIHTNDDAREDACMRVCSMCDV